MHGFTHIVVNEPAAASRAALAEGITFDVFFASSFILGQASRFNVLFDRLDPGGWRHYLAIESARLSTDCCSLLDAACDVLGRLRAAHVGASS
jgi:hypothetical protein